MKNKTFIYLDSNAGSATARTEEEASTKAREMLKKCVKVTALFCSDTKQEYRQMTQKKPYWHSQV